MKNKKINNSAALNLSSAAKENKVPEISEELDLSPVEGSCSPEFSQGCILNE
jgi:hypothetical protein